MDGSLIDAWASLKSFRPKEEKKDERPPPDDKGNPTVNFHGEKRSNQTHESKTDPLDRRAASCAEPALSAGPWLWALFLGLSPLLFLAPQPIPGGTETQGDQGW